MARFLLHTASMRGLAFLIASPDPPWLPHALREAGATAIRLDLASWLAQGVIAPLPDVVVLGADADRDALHQVTRILPMARVMRWVETPAEALATLQMSHEPLFWHASLEEITARIATCARAARRHRELAGAAQDLERQVSELHQENAHLRELAHHDELTCLGNRRHFRVQLAYAAEFAQRYGGNLSLLVADLDGLKALNDSQGHSAGDAALVRVADVVSVAVRKTDSAARIGGDEFAVLMPATGRPAAGHVAERLRACVAALPFSDGVRLTVSIGVATVTATRGKPCSADDLILRADAALYRAKRSGRNRVEPDTPATQPRAGAA
jgi:two-component system chemotaxis family response regulator WspR